MSLCKQSLNYFQGYILHSCEKAKSNMKTQKSPTRQRIWFASIKVQRTISSGLPVLIINQLINTKYDESHSSHTHEHRVFAEKINLQKSYHWQSYLFSVEEGSATSLTWLELMQASSKETCRCFCFLEYWKLPPLTCNVIFKQLLKIHSPS